MMKTPLAKGNGQRHKSALEVIALFQAKYPDEIFAVTDSALGVWVGSEGRFVPFAALTITGEWIWMPFEVLADGKRIERKWRIV